MPDRLLDLADVHPEIDARTHSAARRGWKAIRAAKSSATTHPDGRHIPAYINSNRWVADCPECAGGILCARWCPEACCLQCGHTYTLDFPPDAHEAEQVLLQRPDPGSRNWNCHQGETIPELVRENEVFGGIGVRRPSRVDEPSSHILRVAARFDDSHDGDRYTDDGLAETLRRDLIGTGYTIRHDDHDAPENDWHASGVAEVEVIGQPDTVIAKLKRDLGAEK